MAKLYGLNEDAARRIGAATLAYERGSRDAPPIRFRPGGDDGDPVRIGKTTTAWKKGTLQTIKLREDGSPPNETVNADGEVLDDCVNKFADIEQDKWVMLARAANGFWYVIAAEC
jgi:hypothetical protein